MCHQNFRPGVCRNPSEVRRMGEAGLMEVTAAVAEVGRAMLTHLLQAHTTSGRLFYDL
jgi:hypothetical protein